MVQIFRGYVQTKDKKPIQKFKGIDNLPTLEEVEKYDEYAGILADDTILVDIDTEKETEILLNVVKSLGLKCKVLKSRSGGHFLFKIDRSK